MMKVCFKCEVEKPLSDFYKHAQMADGHLNKCKDCQKADVRRNRRESPNARAYDNRRYHQDSARRAYTHARTPADRQKNPLKYKARSAVGNAIRAGRLHRKPCEVCGTEENVHAHHDDYTQPLDVRWLCALHHARHHAEHG